MVPHCRHQRKLDVSIGWLKSQEALRTCTCSANQGTWSSLGSAVWEMDKEYTSMHIKHSFLLLISDWANLCAVFPSPWIVFFCLSLFSKQLLKPARKSQCMQEAIVVPVCQCLLDWTGAAVGNWVGLLVVFYFYFFPYYFFYYFIFLLCWDYSEIISSFSSSFQTTSYSLCSLSNSWSLFLDCCYTHTYTHICICV